MAKAEKRTQVFLSHGSSSREKIEAVEIGKRIKEARKQHHPKMTQGDLARAIGSRDGSLVGHWERGRSHPSVENLSALAEFLGVTVEWLLHGRNAKHAAREPEAATGGGEAMPARQDDVPIKRTSDPTTDGWFFIYLEADPVGWTRRPRMLERRADIYAIHCTCQGWAPTFMQGHTMWIDPNRPSGPNDFALLIKSDANGGRNDRHRAALLHVVSLIDGVLTYKKTAESKQTAKVKISEVAGLHHVFHPHTVALSD